MKRDCSVFTKHLCGQSECPHYGSSNFVFLILYGRLENRIYRKQQGENVMEKNSSLKFVFAPDSFKGSLSAEKICSLLKNIAEKIFPDCETISIPMSDGGEGAVSVVTSAMGGEIRTVPVKGPMGTIVNAQYGVFGINHAIIEMAAASGLLLVPTDERDILRASTYGTGQLIRSAPLLMMDIKIFTLPLEAVQQMMAESGVQRLWESGFWMQLDGSWIRFLQIWRKLQILILQIFMLGFHVPILQLCAM